MQCFESPRPSNIQIFSRESNRPELRSLGVLTNWIVSGPENRSRRKTSGLDPGYLQRRKRKPIFEVLRSKSRKGTVTKLRTMSLSTFIVVAAWCLAQCPSVGSLSAPRRLKASRFERVLLSSSLQDESDPLLSAVGSGVGKHGQATKRTRTNK